MEKWVSIKWVPMCLNTIILGVPLPEGVSAIAVNLIFFTVIPDGYETGTIVEKLNFVYPVDIFWYLLGIAVKKFKKKKLTVGRHFVKNEMPAPQKRKFPRLRRGGITLGNVPSEYTGKFLPGFLQHYDNCDGSKEQLTKLDRNK